MSQQLIVERSGNIETWWINLPDIRNPITSPEMIEAFVDNTARVDRDQDVRCVILTGAGKAFSAGGNLKDIAERQGMFGGSPYVQRNGYRHGVQRIPLALHDCEVPFVAAVNGPAVGAGCDLAMMCDLRIASEQAFFAESFVQLGLIPGDGGAWFLTQAIGPARAAEMALTGDRIDARTALEWGIVTRVCAPGDLLDEARALAERIAKNPGPSVRMTKKLLREARRRDLAGVLELSASMQALAHHTEEHRASMDKIAKR
ncbi:crotonase/enoyl-CoA hydratase family protein [Prauserella oleivorans]|uniref:Crotonase/enoyl-CoA hydratase family protein n=1 Tax=Prauserella oleivorans TaxID=1478153 RepID=A0ABW5WEG1_9PSEU